MARTRIKICGLMRESDVRACTDLGVDFIGLVMVPASKRCLTLERAVSLSQLIRPFTPSVLLFMDHPAAQVKEAIRVVRPDFLQFHGAESEAYCASFGLPYIKAIAFKDPAHAASLSAGFASAAALLADGHDAGQLGGSGESLSEQAMLAGGRRWFLAGGLTDRSVAAAIAKRRPFAVDVSSGVESAPGCKDHQKIEAFIAEVMKQNAI